MPDYLSSLLNIQMDNKVESELGSLVILSNRAKKYGVERYNDALMFCAACLTSTPPHIKLAMRIRKEMKIRMLFEKLKYRITGGTPLGRVMLGLAVLVYNPPIAMIRISDSSTIFSIPVGRLAGPIALGIIGSIFSILTHISEFSIMKFPDPLVPFLTGLLKPMSGISALFIVLVLESKILPINIPAATATEFYLAISFIAGFSERLVTVVITRAEGAVTDTGGEGSVPRRRERQPRQQR
jgi:hypothetical protein